MSPQEVIIVGAGIFGVSTALFMLERGGYDVTILDKSKVLPAPDAASTDLNKIVRNGDYADPHIVSQHHQRAGSHAHSCCRPAST